MKSLLFCILLFLAGACIPAFTQRPFEAEIAAFLKQDSVSSPPKGAVLFVGSSSFRMWKDVQLSFPGHRIINRGFGGSSLEDVYYYREQIIFPYKPKQVVIYCGENDIASGAPAEEVFNRFKKLFTVIRETLPNSSLVFVSMKPSPSRIEFKAEVEKGNRLIADFLKGKKRTAYVDVYSPMLDSAGKPREELFLNDRLHMNAQGYAIWQRAIGPYLVKTKD